MRGNKYENEKESFGFLSFLTFYDSINTKRK